MWWPAFPSGPYKIQSRRNQCKSMETIVQSPKWSMWLSAEWLAIATFFGVRYDRWVAHWWALRLAALYIRRWLKKMQSPKKDQENSRKWLCFCTKKKIHQLFKSKCSPNHDVCAPVTRTVSSGFKSVARPSNDGITIALNAVNSPKLKIMKFFAVAAKT